MTRDGWVFGTCQISAIEGCGKAVVSFQNENLTATIDGELRCMVPDLITIVDAETAHAIPTERLAYGQRVAIIACSAPPQLASMAALKVMGPRAFGIDRDFQSLTELTRTSGTIPEGVGK